MAHQSGYYRFPTINGSSVIFVCEDDLWIVPSAGGRANRLTSNLAEVSRPFLSPDGRMLTFTGKEEGNTEVYCMPADGGAEKRLTFFGSMSYPVGWTPDGSKIVLASNAGQPFQRIFNLFTVAPQGGMPERMPVGLAQSIAFGPDGAMVIGRNTGDPARWKRYRGGTAGVLWIDVRGNGDFKRLFTLDGNIANPMWLGERIYFISDHEGIGRIYSCNTAGADIREHSGHPEYYARNASTDGRRIVYHAGADLYLYDPEHESTVLIDVDFHSPQVQRNRKFVDAERFLEDYHLHPEGHSIVVTARGKSFHCGAWEDAVIRIGSAQRARYRLTRWLDGKSFITVSDAGGEEVLEVHRNGADLPVTLEGIDIGRPLDLQIGPAGRFVALSNHRYELLLIDIENMSGKVLDKSAYNRIDGISWAPDGNWLAYGCAETQQTCSIKVVNVHSGESVLLTPPRFRDVSPSFDPNGKYLYFLSYREFNPVYDSMQFDLNFPRGMRPYLISLQKDTVSPFVPRPRTPEVDDAVSRPPTGVNGNKNNETKTHNEFHIDFEGIQHRIKPFPVPEARYRQIKGIKGRVLFSSYPVKGSLNLSGETSEKTDEGILQLYDLETLKCETLLSGIDDFIVSAKTETLMYRRGHKLRVRPIAPIPNDKLSNNEAPSRRSGWVDLSRIKLDVNPTDEWKQMFREIWRLQREHFWTENMSGINWEQMYSRYLPLLAKVSTRSEFSDVVWELQGELGTSHAYEYGGDYRKEPDYMQGFIGADFKYDEHSDAYHIAHIVRGDSWYEDADSPLNGLGANVQAGDILLKIGGVPVNKNRSPQELLVNQAGALVPLSIRNDKDETRTVTVKVLASEGKARYREWVENNRNYVHKASNGRIGYVHIPNMGPLGYSEFHRYYLAEIDKDALLVDVRYNGGGHVSQLILEKLARKRIGYNVNRWGRPFPYPADSVLGPIIALTNEYAGSDGDIFSHCFKLMNIGTLVGKRTWGGVIGIWPRHSLVDSSVTTQPEFSFWFRDVAWNVENYGTDPDIEVEITPQDWASGLDPQLNRGLELLQNELEKLQPRIPDFGSKPNLAIPD